MNHITSAGGAFVIVVAGALFVSFLLAWPVMVLWNGCFVPAVDGVKEIGWLQAWGLQFLINMLFKVSITTNKD
jgi:uncharacterized membrane protein YdbT with pleckstrin-like domain